MIRRIYVQDAQITAAPIAEIYNEFIEKTVITFETVPLSIAEMQAKIERIAADHLYFVAEEEGAEEDRQIVGFCFADTWKKKSAYSQTLETTIYVRPDAQKKGYGYALLEHLINAARESDVHALIACITVPNEDSVRLHEKFGFKRVSFFSEVGQKFGRLLDVSDWQLLL